MPSPITYFDRFGTTSDSLLFLLTFLIGTLLQVTLRLIFDFPATLVTVLLVGLMAFYAYILRFQSRTQLSSDRSGDTLYFIGFIFTSVTLGIALWKLGAASEQDSFSTSMVLSDLGVGIATTIWGLVLRVVFTLTRTGIEEVEDEVYQQITNRAQVFGAELTRATQIAEETTTRTQQILRETSRILEESLDQLENRFNKMYQDNFDTLETLVNRISIAIENLHSRIEQIQVPEDLILNSLSDTFNDLNQAVSSLSNRISSINVSTDPMLDAVNTALRPIQANIEGIGTHLQTASTALAGISDLDTHHLSSINNSLQDLSERLSKLSTSFPTFSEDEPIFADYIHRAGESYAEGFKQLSGRLSELDLPSNSVSEQVTLLLESHLQSIAEARESLEEETNKLTNGLMELGSSIKSTTESFDSMTQQFESKTVKSRFMSIFSK